VPEKLSIGALPFLLIEDFYTELFEQFAIFMAAILDSTIRMVYKTCSGFLILTAISSDLMTSAFVSLESNA